MESISWTLKMKGCKPFGVYRDGRRVRWTGGASLPSPRSFATEQEADAFLEGILWAVRRFGGSATVNDVMMKED